MRTVLSYNTFMRYHALALGVRCVHFCVVGLFFSAPFLPLNWQVGIIVVGILTLPLRIIFWKGACPFTLWERRFLKASGDTSSRVHNLTFMEAYFHIPAKVFAIIEKMILAALLLSILWKVFLI